MLWQTTLILTHLPVQMKILRNLTIKLQLMPWLTIRMVCRLNIGCTIQFPFSSILQHLALRTIRSAHVWMILLVTLRQLLASGQLRPIKHCSYYQWFLLKPACAYDLDVDSLHALKTRLDYKPDSKPVKQCNVHWSMQPLCEFQLSVVFRKMGMGVVELFNALQCFLKCFRCRCGIHRLISNVSDHVNLFACPVAHSYHSTQHIARSCFHIPRFLWTSH